jgi:hypothetical protein
VAVSEAAAGASAGAQFSARRHGASVCSGCLGAGFEMDATRLRLAAASESRAVGLRATHFFGAFSSSTSHLPRLSTNSTHSAPSAQWVVCFFLPVKAK